MFKHWVIYDACDPEILKDASDGVPDARWPHWVHRESDHERMRTTSDAWRLNHATCRLFLWLASSDWVKSLESLAGVPNLIPYPILRSGGIRVMGDGDFLSMDRESELHPRFRSEKTLNLVLFLTPYWRDEWGGALMFRDIDTKKIVRSYYPRFGHVVVWESCGPEIDSVAGVRIPQAGPGADAERVTLEMRYLAIDGADSRGPA